MLAAMVEKSGEIDVRPLRGRRRRLVQRDGLFEVLTRAVVLIQSFVSQAEIVQSFYMIRIQLQSLFQVARRLLVVPTLITHSAQRILALDRTGVEGDGSSQFVFCEVKPAQDTEIQPKDRVRIRLLG